MKNILKTFDIDQLSQTGIYKITCLSNNKIYIGSACATSEKTLKKRGFYIRWYGHIYKLRANKHNNKYLQYSWNKYGENKFIFEILELCDHTEAIRKEEYYIKKFKSLITQQGFNIIKDHLANHEKFTEEHKQNIRNALKGKKRPLEIVKKWSKATQQLDLKQNIIAEYYSIAEAGRKTRISRQDIGQAIIGKKTNKAGGYYWRKLKI